MRSICVYGSIIKPLVAPRLKELAIALPICLRSFQTFLAPATRAIPPPTSNPPRGPPNNVAIAIVDAAAPTFLIDLASFSVIAPFFFKTLDAKEPTGFVIMPAARLALSLPDKSVCASCPVYFLNFSKVQCEVNQAILFSKT